ncbi:MAG: hesB domain protein [Candidatus Xenolissoclinum pacificiensis L6]|uniref:HesB domain protein n=1 Tax=Candidatus Xenolissoclinum pacificiensis L6 TaxID=1401685 RepID=W2V2K1_9RICK|nr:MAG: hesB domain protein [Candidatus Xenolissoclinum pacificiensis L6]
MLDAYVINKKHLNDDFLANPDVDVKDHVGEMLLPGDRIPVTVTADAVKAMCDLLLRKFALQSEKLVLGIRVKVVNSGCAGNQYKIEYVYGLRSDDEVFLFVDSETNMQVKIFIDGKTFFMISGAKIDYVCQELTEGFVFVNPNESGRCGCGESFF